MDEEEAEKGVEVGPSRMERRSTGMRLVISGLILIVTTLDFRFGQPGTPLHIAGLAAGILLAGTVLVDHLWLDRLGGAGGMTQRQRPDHPQEPLRTGGPDQ